MINDWKYCIVQMPHSCFCPSCFTRYRGPTGTDHNETDSSVFAMTKKKFAQGDSNTDCWLLPLGLERVHSIVLPLMIKLRMVESKYHMTFDPWEVGRWLLGKSVLLESPGVIQVHCYLWFCPTLCSPHCVWEKGGPQLPLQDASSVPGSVGTQGICECGCSPSQPGQLPVPVCGKGVQAVRCPHTAYRCWGWRQQLAPGAPPGVGAVAAVLRPSAGASPASCRDTGQSPGAPAASPRTLTAASTHTRRKR